MMMNHTSCQEASGYMTCRLSNFSQSRERTHMAKGNLDDEPHLLSSNAQVHDQRLGTRPASRYKTKLFNFSQSKERRCMAKDKLDDEPHLMSSSVRAQDQ